MDDIGNACWRQGCVNVVLDSGRPANRQLRDFHGWGSPSNAASFSCTAFMIGAGALS
jgi:hypothetical protein